MKRLLLLFIASMLAAQSATNIILYELKTENGSLTAVKKTEVTNNSDYNNQPAFLSDNNTLLFVSGETGEQTDIYQYRISDENVSQLTDTEVHEYSPIEYRQNVISVVRIDADRRQRVHYFDMRTKKFTGVGDVTLDVGYHCWFNDRTLAICYVAERPFQLRLIDIKDGTTTTVAKYIGRTLLPHPQKNGILFIENGAERNSIQYLDIQGEKSSVTTVTEMTPGSNDFAVLSDGSFFVGYGTKLMHRKSGEKQKWIEILDVEDDYGNISRIAVSKNRKYVAIVVDAG